MNFNTFIDVLGVVMPFLAMLTCVLSVMFVKGKYRGYVLYLTPTITWILLIIIVSVVKLEGSGGFLPIAFGVYLIFSIFYYPVIIILSTINFIRRKRVKPQQF